MQGMKVHDRQESGYSDRQVVAFLRLNEQPAYWKVGEKQEKPEALEVVAGEGSRA